MQESNHAKPWSMITSITSWRQTAQTIIYAACFCLWKVSYLCQKCKFQIILNGIVEQWAYSVEWHIILSHKLIELNIFRILPPFLPLSCVAWCDWDISNRCIKPDIEYLTINIRTKFNHLGKQLKYFKHFCMTKGETPIYRWKIFQTNSSFHN